MEILWSYKKYKKKWSWKGSGLSNDQYFPCGDNPAQNIKKKLEYTSKTGQENKSLVSVFACFFNWYLQSINS